MATRPDRASFSLSWSEILELDVGMFVKLLESKVRLLDGEG